MSASILEAIVAGSRRASEVREARVPLAALTRRGRPALPEGAFFRALGGGAAASREGGAPSARIIAECKRRSPSHGVLRAHYDPAAIAAAYADAGAAAISVLTEPSFFDGALAHLAAVREAVSLPVLRKDFIVTRYQIAEARAARADAVLLIVAALHDDALRGLLAIARDEGLDALVEAHNRVEVERALTMGARIVGINSRNLHTLSVDTAIFADLVGLIPADVVAVAESGIRDAATLARLSGAGYRACLIGERFMTAADPGEALRAFTGSGPGTETARAV
jgi:indole-3-glycerol phosphate synthase